jgi:tetratricopeptide (TPR) repeat protein
MPMNIWQGIAIRINVLGLRIVEVISPLKPVLSDAVEITDRLNIYGILFFVLLGLCVYMGYKRWVNKSLWALIALCVVSLLPAANLIPLPRFSSPHYGYVLIAPALACALCISSYKPVKTAFMYLAVLWVMIAMYYTYISGFAFKNDLTLFGPEVSHDSHFLEGHYYLGDYAWKHKDLSTAAFHYEMAYHPDSRYLAYVDRTSLFINYAGILLEQGKAEKALPLLEEAHVQRATVDKALITYNLARVYYQKKDYSKVIELLSEDIQWSRSEPYLMLAMSYYRQKEYKNAISTFKKALPFLGTEGKAKVVDLIKKIITGDRL